MKKRVKIKRSFKKFYYALILEIVLIVILGFMLINEKQQITFRAISELEESEKPFVKSIENNFDFYPGFEKEIEFSLFNPEHKNMKVVLTIQGTLNESVSLFLEENIISFLPSEIEKKFKYKIKIDKELEPGKHEVEIVALEIPVTTDDYVPSTSKVVSKTIIYVPYPGKFVEAELEVLNAEKNGTAEFIVSVTNRGKEIIENAYAEIHILSLLEKEIDNIQTDSGKIAPGETVDLKGIWDITVSPGDYIAKITINYDSNTEDFEKQFAIGAKNLSIEGILVNNFQLGEIAKLQILVDNKWNQKLEEVYANLIIYNKEGQVLADIKSVGEEINALSKKELIAYWDTVGVEPGDYSGNLKVYYGDRISEKGLMLRVSEYSLEIFGVGYAIRPRGGNYNMTLFLLVIVIVLLIINLSWLVFFRRSFMKNKRKRK
ncbi:hypothetical protein J4221_01475 [Candidatus Pacearchaeota archaeon]|nr:hypothetical protein [Candidatus Pacearchaeota archaeon]